MSIDNAVQFDYHYGNESEQYTFYRIPKVLMTEERFRKLSDSAKILYALMLNRLSLSLKNGWVDENNRAYIYYTIKDIMKTMNCATEKATKLAAELDTKKGVGLIERVRRGQGKPDLIYVKKFIGEENPKNSLKENNASSSKIEICDDSSVQESPVTDSEVNEITAEDSEKAVNTDAENSNEEVRDFEKQKDSISISETPTLLKSESNYNNINNTEVSNNKERKNDLNNINPINPIQRSTLIREQQKQQIDENDGLMDKYNQTIMQIKKQIDYNSLVSINNPDIINNIVNVMTDVMLINIPYYEIEGNKIPTALVRIRYGQITYENLDAFLIEFGKIYYKIKNPKAYLITALYNISLTAGTALSNRINNDFYGGDRRNE